eukprot:g5727.t1
MPGTDTDINVRRLSVELYRRPSGNQAHLDSGTLPVSGADEATVVEIDLLPKVEASKQVLLEWTEISCFVSSFVIPKNPFIESAKTLHRFATCAPNEQSGPPPKRQILYSVTGHASAGEITALMGPSGSGKTTLISVLGGRAPKMMTTTGEVTYNGIQMDKPIRRSVGYVSQDDLLYSNLTVYETLYYAALLKLPKTMTRTEKLDRVEAVISALGLDRCRDTLIGGGFRRGVSGGERKRVSVGHELLTNPSVLILDEPTSGLDSTNAMRLISSLRSLANGGRVVITTIHQPSSRLFQQLTNLMLLSEGKVLYYGSSHLAVDWFDRHGYPLPYGVNVAEFILDIANGDISGESLDGESSRVHLVDQMTDYLKKNPQGFLERGCILEEDQEAANFAAGVSKQALIGIGRNKSDRWGATWFEQLCILTSRAARNRRFESLSYQNMFQAFGVGIIVILLWWQTGDGITLLTATDVSSLIFFALLYVQFGVMFKAIFTFPSVFQLMVKERTSGMYRLSAFYIAETCCDIPLDYSLPILFLIAVYWGTHLRQTFIAFFSTICSAVLAGLNVQTIGLLLGATVRNPQTATSFATVLMVTLMLVTGFWVRDVPDWLGWLKYLATPYWAFRLVLQIQFHDKTYYDCGGINENQRPLPECDLINDLGDELNLPVDVNGDTWPSILVLFALLIVTRVITYYVLKSKTAF